ncbi:hypothetical protein GMRT_10980 [Giardia muris]|uniref:Uncharacterized protein n=1 Tax=Giardia muris TaxID=5742 RepID=A0A4Z1T5K4_GIAMU|nr:hypothetical protein GMRT_10980 [Giardia muris]|eukprot:TNJ29333.1 hypothetical protein GMRT_10980 [Giardia muris]
MSVHDISIPTIEIETETGTNPVIEALRLHLLKRVEESRMSALCGGLQRMSSKEPRLCFVFGDLKEGRLELNTALGPNTIQHLSLIEQVTTWDYEAIPAERYTMGRLIRRIVVIGKDTKEHLFETTLNIDTEAVKLNLPSPLPLESFQVVLEVLNPKEQFDRVVRLNPLLLDIFKPTHSIVAHATVLPAIDGQLRANYSSFTQREVTLLSALAIHLREGFRQSQLTEELELPIIASSCTISEVRKILRRLLERGLVTYVSEMQIPSISFTIPRSMLISTLSSNTILPFATYFPLSLPRSRGTFELPCPDDIDERIRSDLALLSTCNVRLRRARELERFSHPGGFARALRDVSDCSDLLYGIGWRARPRGCYDPSQDEDLDSTIAEVVTRAGPETVRNSAEAALLGRVRLE